MTVARRKRLGQYFSGVPLGRLLAAITNVARASSLIDPMVGTGDLLQGALDVGGAPDILCGIEIDAAAAREASRRLPSASIVEGNAFASETLKALPLTGFDVVLGNPPFVRYQSGSDAAHGLPSAASVRADLIRSVDLFEHHTRADLDYFGGLARTYSGLADLALPACIISMLLARPGGEVALVLPQAWLTRNYAAPVRHAFDERFELVALVEDESASWFQDALVKTTLLVARKRGDLSRRVSSPATHVRIKAAAADGVSLVGQLARDDQVPELAVGGAIRSGNATAIDGLMSARPIGSLASLWSGSAGRVGSEPAVPTEMLEALGGCESFVSLEQLGVEIGQGLRTGANDFFYVTPDASLCSCRVSGALGGGEIDGLAGLLRAAVRNQSEIPSDAFARDHFASAILDLRSMALPEDLRAADALTQAAYRSMPERLAAHVRKATRSYSGKPGRETLIPDLSAVASNVRHATAARPARFWYQLPDFQARHLPDTYMPRVNASRPRAIVNPERKALVDANFITFRAGPRISVQALAALLNSTFVWAYLELAGAVMGGGALKVEGAMLKRLSIPENAADRIGKMTDGSRELASVDNIILSSVADPARAEEALRRLAASKLESRATHRPSRLSVAADQF